MEYLKNWYEWEAEQEKEEEKNLDEILEEEENTKKELEEYFSKNKLEKNYKNLLQYLNNIMIEVTENDIIYYSQFI